MEDGFPLPRWQYAVGMVGGLAIAITVFSALGSNALVLVGLTSVSLNLWWQTRRRRRLLADASS